VIGSDHDPQAVHATRDNLTWLAGRFGIDPSGIGEVFCADATHVSQALSEKNIDLIVSEPFMGSTKIGDRKSSISTKKIKNVVKGLEKLYIGALKDWKRVLRPGGSVVIALPQYHVSGHTFFVKRVVDTCENVGYTKALGPIEYSRVGATVRRKFYILQKTNN
jgi:tRNA G10  N-methylase Trm11